ncbi:unnamed protein product [Gongylonema pulchrum]|uniref:Uncharacterized protein n=1 Tax=Gongylonema pulchrum TaxID=637853 RepID=A0A3P7NQP3_9BILA|nr:unnamed protein product [Gongylonema pulchrum]
MLFEEKRDIQRRRLNIRKMAVNRRSATRTITGDAKNKGEDTVED